MAAHARLRRMKSTIISGDGPNDTSNFRIITAMLSGVRSILILPLDAFLMIAGLDMRNDSLLARIGLQEPSSRNWISLTSESFFNISTNNLQGIKRNNFWCSFQNHLPYQDNGRVTLVMCEAVPFRIPTRLLKIFFVHYLYILLWI